MLDSTNRIRRGARGCVLAACLVLGFLFIAAPALADGTETLGVPSIGIAAGTGVASGGIGLQNATSTGTLEVAVPAGVTVEQVLLYWSGEFDLNVASPDDTIRVDGVEITGTLIGGPAFFYAASGSSVNVASYRADVTNELTVTPGITNSYEISDMFFDVPFFTFNGNHGVGIVVIYDDGGPLADIQVRDGADLAFCAFPEPRKSMVAQSFVFAPSTTDRTADLTLFFGSYGSDNRPHSIVISDDLGNQDILPDPLVGNLNGDLFAELTLSVNVLAGATQIDVLPRSESQDGSCSSENASLTWIGGTLSVIPPFCGDGIVDPGEECDDGNDDNFDECRNDCTAPFCGDGILDLGEECDDGNNDPGDGCSPDCTTESFGDGCTPGFWKQPQHLDSWVGFAPDDLFDAVFGVDGPGDLTLLEAAEQGGGAEFALGRHAVAALLNASNPDVDYFFSAAEVIALVQEAYATGDFEGAKNLLEAQNELGCPLD